MDGRFRHPGVRGIDAGIQREAGKPIDPIQLLVRLAVLADPRTPELAAEQATASDLAAIRRIKGVRRSLRRNVSFEALRSQSRIVLLLVAVFKARGHALTEEAIRAMISERVTQYADYWEFALWERGRWNGDPCNQVVVANALHMTAIEVEAHLRRLADKVEAVRRARVKAAVEAGSLEHSTVRKRITITIPAPARRTKEFAGT